MKCAKIIFLIIIKLKKVSKKSSPFNDTHLKLGKITSSIKTTLYDIEKGIESVDKNLKDLKSSDYEKKTIYVCCYKNFFSS